MTLCNILSKTLFLTFLSLAFIFVSCKDDDKDPVTVDNNEIVGKWQLTSVAPEDSTKTIPALSYIAIAAPCAYELVFTFESNNKVTPSGCDAAITLLTTSGYLTIGSATTWKVENNTLKLTTSGTTQSLPLIQNGNNMTIIVNTVSSGPAVNALLKFKRI